MEKRHFSYSHRLSVTMINQQIDISVVNTEMLLTQKHMQHIGKELNLFLEKNAPIVEIDSEKGTLTLFFSFEMNERHSLFLSSDDVMIDHVRLCHQTLKYELERYFLSIEHEDKSQAQTILETKKQKRRFIELAKNENKHAKLQLHHKKDTHDHFIRDVDLYNIRDDIVFENVKITGIVNVNRLSMTIKIIDERGKSFTLICDASFLNKNDTYELLHAKKLSGDPVTMWCRATYAEINETYSQYEIFDMR
jgi:uncharacterized protein YegJ (DUF2314 family)